MKLTSTQRPVLTDTQECHIGKYGRMQHAYLKGHQPSHDRTLKLTENVFSPLAEINIVCFSRLKTIEAKMMCQKEVTETLKAANQMEWARQRNSLQSQTGKMVLQGLMSVK